MALGKGGARHRRAEKKEPRADFVLLFFRESAMLCTSSILPGFVRCVETAVVSGFLCVGTDTRPPEKRRNFAVVRPPFQAERPAWQGAFSTSTSTRSSPGLWTTSPATRARSPLSRWRRWTTRGAPADSTARSCVGTRTWAGKRLPSRPFMIC